MRNDDVPLCVDMDGTLVLTDLGVESVLALVRRNPLYLFALPFWLLRGIAHFKREVARRVELDMTRMPCDERVVEWLRTQDHRPRVLCTAADSSLADAMAAHVGLFDAVIASDGTTNLSGTRKAAALVSRHGERGFDYAGNARPDLAVWAHARHAIAVNARAGVLRAAQAQGRVTRVFARASGAWREMARALRPHQWAKNLLVFVAPLAAHRTDAVSARHALVAFAAFCLCASAAYVLNDLLDLDADRRHARKRLRPFASGRLPLLAGLFATPLLTLAAFALAATLSGRFLATLFAYGTTTLAYSLWLKRLPIVDVLVLAALYTLRIIGGGIAIPVDVSGWLLAFSMCLFLGLAMLKRDTELGRLPATPDAALSGRGYRVRHHGAIRAFGVVAGIGAVIVLALYIDSTKSAALYAHQHRLWWLVPLLGAWLARLWRLAARGRMHDDPIVFALTDGVSLVALVLAAGIVFAAL